MVGFISATPVLRMFDVERTRAFYCGFLKATIAFEHRFEPDLPLYLRVMLGDVALDLSEHYGDATPGARVIVAITGLEAFQQRLLALQAPFARPGLVREPWGDLTMTLSDPSSNRLVFTERAAAG